MAEWQIGHQKSSVVLSTRFPVVKWCSHSVAKSAYWWGRDDRWCHNARQMTSFVQKILIGSLHTGQNIWPDWFTSHQSRYYITMVYWLVYEETCDVNIEIAQTMQNIWILLSESQGYWRKGKLWQLSMRLWSKTWSLLGYPGEVTALYIPPLGCFATKVLWKIAQTATYTVQSDFVLHCFRHSWHLMNQDVLLAVIVASICWDVTFHFKWRGLILGTTCITCLVEHSCGSS